MNIHGKRGRRVKFIKIITDLSMYTSSFERKRKCVLRCVVINPSRFIKTTPRARARALDYGFKRTVARAIGR